MNSALLEAPTMWSLVEARAKASGDRAMLVDLAGGRLSFAQFADRCERVAAGLLAQGIGPGTKVTWQLPTRIDSVVASFALARLGAVQNPILHLYRDREVGSVLRASRPEFVLVPGIWRDFDYAEMV